MALDISVHIINHFIDLGGILRKLYAKFENHKI